MLIVRCCKSAAAPRDVICYYALILRRSGEYYTLRCYAREADIADMRER